MPLVLKLVSVATFIQSRRWSPVLAAVGLVLAS